MASWFAHDGDSESWFESKVIEVLAPPRKPISRWAIEKRIAEWRKQWQTRTKP